jgi:hypothetical protein
MDRRRFITRALTIGSGMAGSLVTSPAQSGVFEHLLTGVDQTRGTLLDRIDIALRNANKMFRGIYHGYGLGIQKVLEETDELLPTTPKRRHPGWPHVHCVCHCSAVASLGEEDGIGISRIAGMADELNQAYFSHIFYDIVYPLTWKDLLGQHSGRGGLKKARLEMKYVMDYSFGDIRTRRRALGLASISDKKNNAALKDYRNLIYGLVDALESSWQQSDFHDNAIGREGGCKCPQGLSAKKKREWCVGWCTQQGIPANVAEGPGTARPWGPFHPLNPGPVPTMHDALYGGLKEPFDPKLNVPPPEFVPIRRPVLKGPG